MENVSVAIQSVLARNMAGIDDREEVAMLASHGSLNTLNGANLLKLLYDQFQVLLAEAKYGHAE